VSNTPSKALLFLAAPTASFAQVAGEMGSGKLSISGNPLGPANPGGLNNVLTNPGGVSKDSKVAPLPLPHITVPVIPQFKLRTELAVPRGSAGGLRQI
jgi:hypothetical protein